MDLLPLGDCGVVAVLGGEADEATLGRVRELAAEIAATRAPGILDIVPAYARVTVVYDPARFAGSGTRPFQTVCQLITWCAARVEARSAEPRGHGGGVREVEIPVCYGGEFGPDLQEVAQLCSLAPEEIIGRHSSAHYRVHAIGFVPGFPYLGGLPPSLHAPRRSTPRSSVPAGSVGIGGAQTGIYPFETPGGWRLIGRTPLKIFRPRETPPGLLRAGDRVRFRAIDAKEFAAWS